MTAETVIFWVLGGACGCIGALFVMGHNFAQRMTKLETSADLFRMTLDLLGRKTMKALHSPDDHLGLDWLVDEYVRRNYELDPQQWQLVHDICEKRLESESLKPEDRPTVLLGYWLATHKLAAFGGMKIQSKEKAK